jgi:hypothetical protein
VGSWTWKKQIYLYGVCLVFFFTFSVFSLPCPILYGLPCEVEKHGVPEKEMLNLAVPGRQVSKYLC